MLEFNMHLYGTVKSALVLGFILLAQAACSSSGSSDSSSTSPQIINNTLSGAEVLDSEELEFLRLINEYRAQNGRGPLQISVTLTKASQWMATDMATNNYLGHTDSLNRGADVRIDWFGYPRSTWGENCAAGHADAQNTFLQWKNSAGHNANMLGSAFQAIGIGRAYNVNATYKSYWTTDFGSTVD